MDCSLSIPIRLERGVVHLYRILVATNFCFRFSFLLLRGGRVECENDLFNSLDDEQ